MEPRAQCLLKKVVSGGQSGVDRAALDAAGELGSRVGAGARTAGARRLAPHVKSRCATISRSGW